MTDNKLAVVLDNSASIGRDHFKVIATSSVASVFEWFDFFLYGSLAVIISRNFFSNVNETSAFVLALLAFAAGFALRPFGAIVFGFFGDLWGRKNTFLITLTLMRAATFGVGLLPTYRQIGAAVPWVLVGLRMLQGLSVGGVYGGSEAPPPTWPSTFPNSAAALYELETDHRHSRDGAVPDYHLRNQNSRG
jgi:MFS family permease